MRHGIRYETLVKSQILEPEDGDICFPSCVYESELLLLTTAFMSPLDL